MKSFLTVTVGVIGRAHGIKGDVTIELHTDEPERRFNVGAQVFHSGSPLTVVASRWQGKYFLVRFEEINSRNAAEEARGWVIEAQVESDESPDLEDEYYDRQLVGLIVKDHQGIVVGEVSEIIHLPLQDLLSVATEDGEKLIPLVKALVPRIELSENYLQLADVPGLITEVD